MLIGQTVHRLLLRGTYASHHFNFYFLLWQVTSSLMNPPGLKNQTLMLAETEMEKNKYINKFCISNIRHIV